MDKRRATFTSMEASSPEDWQTIGAAHRPFQQALPDRVLAHLNMLAGECGYAVDRLEHSLQTATRAVQGGESEDYVIAALLHDIGDTLAPNNHPDLAAAMLKPFVSGELHWMVAHHGVFQGYYFFHHVGMDRNQRERFRGHPNFEMTARFCHLYDQNSFDPGFEAMPLDAFEPMLRRVFGEVRNRP